MRALSLIISLLAIWLIPPRVWALEPSVEEAHIYPSMAVLTIPMPEDEELELPGTLDRNSIKIMTGEGLALKSYRVQEKPRAKWIPKALLELFDETEKSKERMDLKEAEAESLVQAMNHLDRMRPDMGSLDFFSQKEDFLKIRMDLAEKLLKAQRDLAKAQEIHSDLFKLFSSKKPEDGGTAIAITAQNSLKDGAYVLCSTAKAKWSPSYRLALDLENSVMTAELTGTVSQKTGLDFKGIVKLHTQRPSGQAYLDLSPVTVELDDEERPVVYSSPRALNNTKAEVKRESLEQETEETVMDSIYGINSIIPGDGTPITAALETWSAQVKPVFAAVPSMSSSVYLTAEGIFPGSLGLDGPFEAYVDGRYSGKGYIPKLVKGEEFSVVFGEISGMQVSREKKIPKDSSSWTGKGLLRQGYTVKVLNGLDQDMEITVKDQIPIPTDGKISLTVSEISPQPESTDPETGLMTWILKLKPGETKEINVLYDLKYPSDKKLVFSR